MNKDIVQAVALGFTGKLCIHPAQVPIVNRGLLPDEETIAWATGIVAAADDVAVTVQDGRMVDPPVLARARAILARSERPSESSTVADAPR